MVESVGVCFPREERESGRNGPQARKLAQRALSGQRSGLQSVWDGWTHLHGRSLGPSACRSPALPTLPASLASSVLETQGPTLTFRLAPQTRKPAGGKKHTCNWEPPQSECAQHGVPPRGRAAGPSASAQASAVMEGPRHGAHFAKSPDSQPKGTRTHAF